MVGGRSWRHAAAIMIRKLQYTKRRMTGHTQHAGYRPSTPRTTTPHPRVCHGIHDGLYAKLRTKTRFRPRQGHPNSAYNEAKRRIRRLPRSRHRGHKPVARRRDSYSGINRQSAWPSNNYSSRTSRTSHTSRSCRPLKPHKPYAHAARTIQRASGYAGNVHPSGTDKSATVTISVPGTCTRRTTTAPLA